MACDDAPVGPDTATQKTAELIDQIPRDDILKSYDQVFLDPSGTVNLLAGWDKGDLELVGLFFFSIMRLHLLIDSCDIMRERPWSC
jgi:hypothetical protein